MPSHQSRQMKKPALDKVSGSVRGAPGAVDTVGISYGYSEMQGWRKQMEDAHCASFDPESDLSFFGVFDGHGGPGAARFCAQTLAPKIIERVRGAVNDTSISDNYRQGRTQVISGNEWKEKLRKKSTDSDGGESDAKDNKTRRANSTDVMQGAVRSAFLDVDNTMSKHHSMYVSEEDKDSYGDPGTTAVTVLVTPKKLIISHVGDSRGILVRNGKIVFATKDHKPSDKDEESRIVEAGGFVVSGRICRCLAVARSLGDHNFKQDEELIQEDQMVTAAPDVAVFNRDANDEFCFLGCDGIFDVMGNNEIVDYIKGKLIDDIPLSEICSSIVDKCFKKGSTDNMTALLVCFPGVVKGSDTLRPRRVSTSSSAAAPSWVSSLFTVPENDGSLDKSKNAVEVVQEDAVELKMRKSLSGSTKESSSRPSSILMTLGDIDQVADIDNPDNEELESIAQLKDLDRLAWIEMSALDHMLLANEHVADLDC